MGEIRGLLVISCLGVASLGAGLASAEKMVLNENYNVLPINSVEDRRMDAYVPRMRELKNIPQSDLEGIRKFADHLIKDLRTGKLAPLVSAYHGEDVMNGQKGQWITEVAARCHTLLSNAHQTSSRTEATADAIRVAGMLETARFCSFQTLLKSNTQSKQSLRIIEQNIDKVAKLPESTQLWFRTKPHPDASLESLEARSVHQRSFYAARFPTDNDDAAVLGVGFAESSRLAHKFAESERTAKLIRVAQAHGFSSQR